MEKKPKEFEFVKDEDKDKRNYIFKKDAITKTGFVFIVVVLILLILAIIFMPKLMS